MSSAKDPFSILNRNPEAAKFAVPAPKAKVGRYWAGKEPEWNKNSGGANTKDQEDDSDDDIFPGEYDLKSFSGRSHGQSVHSKSSNISVMLDSRSEAESIREKIERRREIHKSIIVTTEEEKKGVEPKIEEKQEEEPKRQSLQRQPPSEIRRRPENIEHKDTDDIEKKRAEIKARLLQREEEEKLQRIKKREDKLAEDSESKRKGQERMLLEEEPEEEDDEEEDDDSDEEEDEEKEERGLISMLKPVFVSRDDRETRDKKLEEEIALKEEKKKAEMRKKVETKLMVIEAVRNDEILEKEIENLSDQEMPDDNDNVDEAKEYELWKIRELRRIKRDREEKDARQKEKDEIERRRNLTDEQRRMEDIKLGSDDTQKIKKTAYRFMQKYFHKGTFFQDESRPDLLNRDFNIAVGEDLWDKSSLPKVLQKRRGDFGRASQSKYTHLTDQDTTNFDPYYKVDQDIQQKMVGKMGGYKGANIMDRKSLKKQKL